jgi:hypothetical protein
VVADVITKKTIKTITKVMIIMAKTIIKNHIRKFFYLSNMSSIFLFLAMMMMMITVIQKRMTIAIAC